MAEDFRDTLRSLLQQVGGEPTAATPCAAAPPPCEAAQSRKDCRLNIYFEKKGRNGKQVLIVGGFPADMSDDAIAELASQLKRRLGVGGSARGGEILIQGDRREALRSALEALGWRVKG